MIDIIHPEEHVTDPEAMDWHAEQEATMIQYSEWEAIDPEDAMTEEELEAFEEQMRQIDAQAATPDWTHEELGGYATDTISTDLSTVPF